MDNLQSICENKEFRRIYTRGKSYIAPGVVTYVLLNKRHRQVRVGITTSKKTGNAVRRNRSRRVLREAFRQVVPELKEGYDIILVARTRTPFLKSTEIEETIRRHFKEAGILK